MINETLRLFKAVLVFDKDVSGDPDVRRLKDGFIFAPSVVAQYNIPELAKQVNSIYGRDAKELNSSFHKSFEKVRTASDTQLFFEQMIHYLTTYGAEALGVYNEESVYVPAEALDIPEFEGARVVVIRGLTKEELKAELKVLLSGIALAERTLTDAIVVARAVGFNADDLSDVGNYEARAALCEFLDIVPSDPVEFLRVAVYKTTGSALLIKNKRTVSVIEQSEFQVDALFAAYEVANGLVPLAKIFNRYKPLFLAFRKHNNMRYLVNRVRRLAKTHHEPMREDFLNSVTAQLARGERVPVHKLNTELAKVNVYRKIRLAYALKYRLGDPKSIMYRVRNGRAWATAFDGGKAKSGGIEHVYNQVIRSIVSDLGHLKDKKVYVPANVHYALPATEKQFTGTVPTGSYAEINEDLIFGVYWENQPGRRVDLDLSLTNASGKIGWDGYYRDSQNGIYFTGDVTDAPRGATELFHVGAEARGVWLLNVNDYTRGWNGDDEVPFKVVVSQETRRNMKKNYVLDPNKIIMQSNAVIAERQKTLGIVVADDESTRFYFAETGLGNNITASVNEYTEHARKYLLDYYRNAPELNDVLRAAGVELVDAPEKADIDLSPESVDKTTFIKLLNAE